MSPLGPSVDACEPGPLTPYTLPLTLRPPTLGSAGLSGPFPRAAPGGRGCGHAEGRLGTPGSHLVLSCGSQSQPSWCSQGTPDPGRAAEAQGDSNSSGSRKRPLSQESCPEVREMPGPPAGPSAERSPQAEANGNKTKQKIEKSLLARASLFFLRKRGSGNENHLCPKPWRPGSSSHSPSPVTTGAGQGLAPRSPAGARLLAGGWGGCGRGHHPYLPQPQACVLGVPPERGVTLRPGPHLCQTGAQRPQEAAAASSCGSPGSTAGAGGADAQKALRVMGCEWQNRGEMCGPCSGHCGESTLFSFLETGRLGSQGPWAGRVSALYQSFLGEPGPSRGAVR